MARNDSDGRPWSERVRERYNDFKTTQVITPIFVVVVLVAFLIGMITWAFNRLRDDGAFMPENTLPVLLIVATISLLLAISALVVIFARLNLTSWRSALGMPEGSIRAIIALLLIMLFFITAVFLYADVGRPASGEPRSLEGIDETRLAGIPTDQIVELEQTSETPARYTVTLQNEKNDESKDIAKQLITTVSTLVVAIAAFYFGSNSVQQAVEATRRPPDAGEGDGGKGAPPTEPAGEPADAPGAGDATDESTDLVVATTADNDEIPDSSESVEQHHAPAKGAPE